MKNSPLQREIIKFTEENEPNLMYLEQLLTPTLIFNLQENHTERKLSKICGNPIFPFDEPTNNINEHYFLGQIELIHYKKIIENLTIDGILYFFVNDNIDHYPITKNDYKIIYINDVGNKEMNVSNKIIDGYSLNFFESFTIPSYQESYIEKGNYDELELQTFEDIVLEVNSQVTNYEYDFAHQILGNPQAIQGTVRFWWAINYLGIEEKSNYSQDELEKIHNEEDNFILLLQINLSDPKINLQAFGDGILYFGIHKNDFKNSKFENTILVIQNT